MIALTQQEKTILSLIEPLADGLGMEIVRVRLMGGKRPTLQVMTEKAGGAPTNVEDCAALSHAMSPVLEAADPVSDPYRLEVSTPGIDRPLTREGDFGRWAGHLAKVELAMPINGRRRFQGVIQREDDNGVAIELDDETELVAQVHEMSKASLVLTDELIDAAKQAGGLPPQPDDENFSGLEVDETEDDDNNEEESGASR
ncbi:MAG: ribosome maturation factor RimP [Henriciella sp.]|uniref:ribosome maturation factor RimP n=1 Tax=Henriciella sp. TaxID=1968823 RepID=UPI003C78B006